jgi:predicted transcriptional regulator
MNPEVASAILNMLRDARALVYRDAESFDQAAAMLEHIGQLLSGEVGVGLGSYEGTILGLAGQAPRTDSRHLRELFKTVKEARNDSVHSGAFIRHHVLSLVELILILEEAVSVNGRFAGDLMVRNPVTAELWHNVATVRRNMLTNSFSYLPIKADGKWMLVSDQSVVAYLRGASNAERNRRLGATVENAITSSSLPLEAAPKSSVDTPVEDVKASITQLPVLVVDSTQNLLGILTAFDLL